MKLVRLTAHDEAGFAKLVALYEAAFPASERKSTATLRNMLADAANHLYLAEEANETVGFAILRVLQGTPAALFEYMAIAPRHRGHGLGRQLFQCATAAVEQPTILLEVESDYVESPERELRTRRKNFYRSLGASEIEGLRWLMPPVSAALPPPMDMLVYPAAQPAKPEIQRWLTEIYVQVYEHNPDDPRIAIMMQGL